jgi:hypothetical protein
VRAYPYDVELRLDNPNTRESTLQLRRVYAYSVPDAVTQAMIEAAADAGSVEMKVLRVAPPQEVWLTALVDEAIATSTRGLKTAVGDR